MSTARISARRSKRLARRATEDESVGRDERTVWLSRTEASQIAPGLTPEKLADLRRRRVGGPSVTEPIGMTSYSCDAGSRAPSMTDG